MHSTAEYCAPVCCRSAHTRLVDPAITNALRIATGCLRSTPADNLPSLTGIQPTEHRRNGATLSLARRAMEPGHLFHSALTRPSSANARRLKSIHPLYPPHNISSYVRCSGRITNENRSRRTTPQDSVFSSPTPAPIHPGMTLPRRAWVRLNRLRTGVGRFCSCLYEWGMASSAAVWPPLRMGYGLLCSV